ncbi:MAG: elongation factor G [Candidatus Omnitrophica bacterium]|nr:elongation factor G [Candidatus Omnitrophota bacterium]
MAVSAKDIRNVVVLGHSGDGKTTLVESLLYKGGAIAKKGSVNEGTTVSDYNEDEKERKNSIDLSVSFYQKNGIKVNLLDAPGFLDFINGAIAGVHAADGAVLIADAVGGVKVGTAKGWKIAKKKNLPVLIVVNKMDKENSNFEKVLAAIQESLSKSAVAIAYPVGSGHSFSGIVNLLTKEGADKLSADDKTKVEALSSALVEGVAESDDALLEKYLSEGALTPDELAKAFRAGVTSGKIVPVIPASIEKEIGIKEVAEMIEKYFPSPLDAAPAKLALKEGETEAQSIEPKFDAPFASQVFKTISDPYTGQLSIFRVYQGEVKTAQSVKNVNREAVEKLSHLSFLRGKELIETEGVSVGDIAVVAKLKDTHTGDSLCAEKNPVLFKKIAFPEPAVSFSLKPKSRADEDKISGALVKLCAEDPSFHSTRDAQTNELVVSGMGELHLKTMLNRIKKRYGVESEVGVPKIAYRETIALAGDSHYKHKKQSGGAGQFAEVWVKVEPLARKKGFEFVDEIVGGVIPRPFIASCEKGIRKSLLEGILSTFPVVDIRATVYDGKTHPVDSKDIAFQIAAAHAFRAACEGAKPVLLEPVMHVEFTIPKENMGDVTGSLIARRGRVQGMREEGGMDVVAAEMPLEEMYKYANELKSITGGKASYTMSFSTYEVVPGNIAQKVLVENARKKVVEEE